MPGLTVGFLAALGGSALLASVDVSGAAFARAEIAVGSAPRAPGADSEASFVGEVRPGAGVRLRSPRSQFILRFGPRFYYRTPNLGGLERPLVLLRADASHQYQLTSSLRWLTEANASRGEVDYTSSELAFTSPVASRLQQPVITLLTADASTGFSWRQSPRYELEANALAGHTRPIGDSAEQQVLPGAPPAFPTTTTLGVDVVQRWELDRRSSFLLPVRGRFYSVKRAPEWVTVTVEVGYERRLDLRTTFEASAGVTWAEPERGDSLVFPSGTVALEHVLHSRRAARVTNRVAFSLDASLDPTVGRVRPTAGVDASLRTDLGPRWSLTLLASGYTTTTVDPLAPDAAETSINASVTAAYALAPGLDLDFGARYSARAPRLNADNFELVERQLWAFAGVSWAIGFEAQPDAGLAASGAAAPAAAAPAGAAVPAAAPAAVPAAAPAAPL